MELVPSYYYKVDQKIIADIDDYTRGGTKFERGVQSMTDKFGRINLMDYWTSGVKANACSSDAKRRH